MYIVLRGLNNNLIYLAVVLPFGNFSLLKKNCLMYLHLTMFSFYCVCFQFKPEEIAAIMKDFDEPGSLAPTGLYLGGTKYMVIQGEPGAVIRGKKVSLPLSLSKHTLRHICTLTHAFWSCLLSCQGLSFFLSGQLASVVICSF